MPAPAHQRTKVRHHHVIVDVDQTDTRVPPQPDIFADSGFRMDEDDSEFRAEVGTAGFQRTAIELCPRDHSWLEGDDAQEIAAHLEPGRSLQLGSLEPDQ
jgi:hypothetical protein